MNLKTSISTNKYLGKVRFPIYTSCDGNFSLKCRSETFYSTEQLSWIVTDSHSLKLLVNCKIAKSSRKSLDDGKGFLMKIRKCFLMKMEGMKLNYSVQRNQWEEQIGWAEIKWFLRGSYSHEIWLLHIQGHQGRTWIWN